MNCSTNPRIIAWRKSNYKAQISQVTSWKTAARPLPFFSGSWRKVASVKIWNLPSTWCAPLLVCLLHTAASGSETSSSHAPETLLEALTPNERLRAALTSCINTVLESVLTVQSVCQQSVQNRNHVHIIHQMISNTSPPEEQYLQSSRLNTQCFVTPRKKKS